MPDLTTVTLEDLLAAELATGIVDDAFGLGKTLHIRAYADDERGRWLGFARKQVGDPDHNPTEVVALLEALTFAECALASPDPKSRLVPVKDNIKTVASIRSRIGSTHWRRIIASIDRLSGADDEVTQRLAAAGVPTQPASSASGACTDSEDSPPSSTDTDETP